MDEVVSFDCRFCNKVSASISSHLQHAKVHRHISNFTYCGFRNSCKSKFTSDGALRIHVIRNHRVFVGQRKVSMFEKIPSLMNSEAKFKCSVEFCGERFFHQRLLMKHLKAHLSSGVTTPCPYPECKTKVSSWHSLTGHTSRHHRYSVVPITSEPTSTITGLSEIIEPQECVLASFGFDFNEPEEDESSSDDAPPYVVALAQFYQKVELKHLIPESTVQYIAKELKFLLQENECIFLENLKTVLSESGISDNSVSDILTSVSSSNNIANNFHALRTTYMRKQYFKNHFHFVEPQCEPLSEDSFYYYVPIAETIQAAFKNKSWTFDINSDPPSTDGHLKDFTDGQNFKSNTFFQENPKALKIILYQDGFEMVCPIGPAKSLKHKVIGVYMAFGNLPSDVRFQKESIQLVALIRNCDFDHAKVYGKIVKELLVLQTEGVNIQNYGNLKAGLAFIAGDNLGSHQLGGFVENFSKANFFCRYCLLQRKLFNNEGGEVRHFKIRTTQSYNNALGKVKINPVTKKIKSHQGVKFDSEFNQIAGFHVCNPGLSPCLGHELGEGLIAYDLKLFIKYFVTTKEWFTLDELNNMIENFPYSEEDTRDKPIKIKSIDKDKLAGGAWQLWIFLRLFPLIVFGRIKDIHDPVWECLLQLKDITELAVSPDIHESHLEGYQALIDNYLVSRRELFPHVPLRPKHHYLFHYPWLISQFGPLIKVWTLRFESKHTFFKRAWKASNNSINILKTLSFKHEFLQSWVRSGANVKSTVESGSRSQFLSSIYSSSIVSAVQSNSRFVNFEECKKIVIKGTLYSKGNVLVLKQLECGDVLVIGTIALILIDASDNVKFVVERGIAELQHYLRAYKIKPLNGFDCVDSDALLTYYPHHYYLRDTSKFICLKHALVGERMQMQDM